MKLRCTLFGESKMVAKSGQSLEKSSAKDIQGKKDYFTNIVGIKGCQGVRKRKRVGMSGGWQAGEKESGRSSWRCPGRRLRPATMGKPVLNSMRDQPLDEYVQVDRLSSVQEDEVMDLEYSTVGRQKKLLDMCAEKMAVTQ